MTYANRKALMQFVRYAAVGVINTTLTLFVIYVCKGLLGMNPWVSNAIGYVAGFVNSFLWNKLWVFNSHNAVVREAAKFVVGFFLCYGLQLFVTWVLTEHTTIGDIYFSVFGMPFSGYGVATLIGMVIYTLANFVFNRAVTFK